MRYLLDTHTVIWYLDNSRRLPPRTEEIIDDDNNRVYISSISLWETAIKVNLGKLELNSTFDQFLENVRNSDFGILQIKDAYLKKLSILPSVHGTLSTVC
jgi:PIN domain nuclease of toxin-antitoxin system